MPNNLMSRFEGDCALVAPEREGRFHACLEAASATLNRIAASDAAPLMQDDFWYRADDWRSAYRPYVVRDGVLQVPVMGVLLHNFPWAFGDYATGYAYIRKAVERGMADPAVRGIALIVDSPGGEVAGCFDLVDALFAMRGPKPIRAFAADYACSAAYAVASAANTIAVTRCGQVGSIGVVTMHVDRSRALEEMGLKVTFIFAGKHKVDGNGMEPLPADVRARIQARIDTLYGIFVATVARNRPALSDAAVRETEALTFGAEEAIALKLADMKAMPMDDALAAFAVELSSDPGDESMSGKDNSAADQAAIDAARAEGAAQGRKEGATQERERIAAILGSEEAKGRDALASHFALKTDMTADVARAALAVAPKAQDNPLAAAMAGIGNPDVKPDAANGDDTADAVASILNAAKLVKG